MPRDDAADHDLREQRFHSLYQRYYGLIRAYARRRTWSPEDAADVVAETFTIAWRRIGELPAPPADRLWLYGVARHVIVGRHRSAGRRRSLLARLISSQPPAASPARLLTRPARPCWRRWAGYARWIARRCSW